jgi:hypothetical protein
MQDRTDVSLKDFMEWTKQFDVHPVVDDGEVIGAAMVYGQEIHLGLTRTPKTPHRKEWREILGDLLNNGPVITRVAPDCQQGIDFVTRLGFEETHRDSTTVFFEKRPHHGHGTPHTNIV